MSALSALGLEPAPEETEGVTPPETPEPVTEPETAPVEPAEPADEPIVVPEGAANPDAVKAAIQAERKTAREANARARDLERQIKERDEQDKPLEERLSAADDRAQKAELRALRLEVALENGLSITLAPRLAGSTKEELEADAAALITELGVKPAAPGMDGGYKPGPVTPVDPAKQHSLDIGALLGRARQG